MLKQVSFQTFDSTSRTCDASMLELVFSQTFFQDYHTLLQGGADEPLYQPSGQPGSTHLLYYREDYISSALHEIAHWCLAGEARRQQVDFGYWYLPDGRSEEQQRLFEKVEVKPQALEWMFSVAANHRFHISVDNLSGESSASQNFVIAVSRQAQNWCEGGMPQRGAMFVQALSQYFGTTDIFNSERYVMHTEEVAEPVE